MLSSWTQVWEHLETLIIKTARLSMTYPVEHRHLNYMQQ
jgi:hypothetical protein